MGKVRFLLLICTIMLILSGCKKQKPDIVIIDSFQEDSEYGDLVNAPYLQFECALDEWRNKHPEIYLVERNHYHGQKLGALAQLGIDHLPDIFITSSTYGRLFAESGFVLSLIDFQSEGIEPFTYNDSVFAIPVLEPSYSVLVYDRDNYNPTENMTPEKTLLGADVVPTILSSLLSDKDGQQWFHHMIVGDKEAAFTDDYFINKLELLREVILSLTLKERENKHDLSDFAKEKYPAIIVTGDSLYKLLDTVKKENPELYSRLEFSSMPGSDSVPCGYTYGIFLNAKLVDEPEKLEICVDLCSSLFNLNINRERDETLDRLSEFFNKANTTPMLNQYLTGTFWSETREGCFNIIGSTEEDKTIREYAAYLQDNYEKNYLNRVTENGS